MFETNQVLHKYRDTDCTRTSLYNPHGWTSCKTNLSCPEQIEESMEKWGDSWKADFMKVLEEAELTGGTFRCPSRTVQGTSMKTTRSTCTCTATHTLVRHSTLYLVSRPVSMSSSYIRIKLRISGRNSYCNRKRLFRGSKSLRTHIYYNLYLQLILGHDTSSYIFQYLFHIDEHNFQNRRIYICMTNYVYF